jgi:trimethylamine--corrinoid protein Co-methyltransferase
VQGIAASEDSVSLDLIRATCSDGPGHWLGWDRTLALMQTDDICPTLRDRTSPKEYIERDRPDLL